MGSEKEEGMQNLACQSPGCAEAFLNGFNITAMGTIVKSVWCVCKCMYISFIKGKATILGLPACYFTC